MVYVLFIFRNIFKISMLRIFVCKMIKILFILFFFEILFFQKMPSEHILKAFLIIVRILKLENNNNKMFVIIY